jgi:anti-sigma-K factor RskA
MIPEDPEELNLLAGEYVLGVLETEAAREVEAALASHAQLRNAIAFWEDHLAGLSALAAPADPPAGAWAGIASRIGPASGNAPPRLWNSLAVWRWSTAVAGAIAASLALYIAIGLPAPVPAPTFVAVLHAPQQDQAAWVATAGRNGLLIHAVANGTVPSDRAYELWAIAPGATKPQALGVIPPDGRLALGALPAAIRNGATLAISIEPAGGSPTGQPTGPVVFAGTLVTAD